MDKKNELIPRETDNEDEEFLINFDPVENEDGQDERERAG